MAGPGFSYQSTCYSAKADALQAFEASFPWQASPHTVSLNQAASIDAAGLIQYQARSRDMATGVSVVYNGSFQLVSCDPTTFYSSMGITSEALAIDYAFGFSAVGLGFVLAFPIAAALKALKLI